ncbi:MAG: hypothetical protein MMC33_000697 [Icmadophila ericetorum]|nr:hypothetical protein [Icmadophila ericetorum]
MCLGRERRKTPHGTICEKQSKRPSSTLTNSHVYSHINSVDKNSGGDYLVSSRHVETVYKINGSSGDIIWQLGGKESSFEMVNGLNFSFQHNARFRAENSTTTTISIFDNAYDGFNGSSLFSQGKIIAVSNETMKAELLMAYGAPDPSGGLVSASQGNVQYLPNGNKFLGWGSQCYVSESTDDGTPVFYAYFATTGALQYRSYRFNFTGNPTTTPALYTYAKDTTSQTAYYVSWNGATEVGSWNIYSGSEPTSLQMVGSVKKNGFETTTTVPQYYAYTIVEAVAGNGTALRNSTVIKTFVPGPQLAQSCTDIQCPLIGGYQVEPVVQAIQSTLIAPTITNTPTPTTDLPASTSADQSTGNLTSTSPAQVGSASRLRSPGLDPWLPIIALSIACVSAVSWFS